VVWIFAPGTDCHWKIGVLLLSSNAPHFWSSPSPKGGPRRQRAHAGCLIRGPFSRQPPGFPDRRRIWVFATLVLSGRLRLRTSWVGRVDSVEERPQKRPQTHAGSDGVPARNAKSGAVAELRATGRPREEEIRRPGSSPEHRAATPAGKKTPLNSVPAPTASSLSSGALVAAYEELRRQVLLNHHGPGVAVLMRRGVWAWISVCSADGAALPTKAFTQSEADPIIPQGLHTEIVVMLAGMLLGRYQEASV